MKLNNWLLLMAIISFCLPAWSYADISKSERAALIELYNATDGDNWTDNTNWKQTPLESDGFGAYGTEGTWYGVNVGSEGDIQLSLNGNQLSGSIPGELGNLSNLESLCLEDNQLSGSIPSELGNLSNLTALDLANNQLSGSIPSELGNLSNLTALLLYSNQLSGSIPSELGNLSNLEELFLGYNQLSGSIPSELGNLSNLKELYLAFNQLSGSIPGELGNLSSVKVLMFYANQLQGAIPEALKNLTQLDDNDGLQLGANTCLYVDDSDDGSLQAFIDLKAGDGWEEGAQTDCKKGSSGDNSFLYLLLL